jgi:predicted site-specific integrase-resolvase
MESCLGPKITNESAHAVDIPKTTEVDPVNTGNTEVEVDVDAVGHVDGDVEVEVEVDVEVDGDVEVDVDVDVEVDGDVEVDVDVDVEVDAVGQVEVEVEGDAGGNVEVDACGNVEGGTTHTVSVLRPKNLCAQQAAKFLGVTGKTLRRWHELGYIRATRTPGNQRVYDINSIRRTKTDGGAAVDSEDDDDDDAGVVEAKRRLNAKGRLKHTAPRLNLIYARVSSSESVEDLKSQVQKLTQEFSGFRVFSDVGSGINFKRPGLQKLIKRCLHGNVASVVIARPDVLCGFGFDLFEFLFRSLHVKLVVHECDTADAAAVRRAKPEFSRDLLALVNGFSVQQQPRTKRPYVKRTGTAAKTNSDAPHANAKRGPGRPRKLPLPTAPNSSGLIVQ